MPRSNPASHGNGAVRRIVVYDTTLRDGAQGPAVSFSASDKVRIARALDGLGFDYVEGGFPGSNPKDEELFATLRAHPLKRARLAAFGATRRAGGTCEDDPNLKALAESGADTWTLVGKSDTWQVSAVLGTTPNENLAMIRESVAHGIGLGKEVVFDAEHFFDGFARDAEYAVEACLEAARAGAMGWASSTGRSASASTATTIASSPSPTLSRAWPRARTWCRARSTDTASGAATRTSSPLSQTWS
jgi:isopropylmalate/homocitrate/citramalate synthase